MDRSGRGFNPRPAQNLRPCVGRGLNFRPCAGRGLNPRPESSTPAKCPPATPNPEMHSPEMNLLIDSRFPSAVPLPSRGWIVPVGGSTPDRLRLNFRPCAGRGLNPRPESSTPAKCPSATPNPEMHSPEMNLLTDSCFPSAVPLPSRGWIVPVGGSTPDRKAPPTPNVRPQLQIRKCIPPK